VKIEGLDQMTYVLYADIEDMFRTARHSLVIGQPRCLSLDTEIFWRDKNGRQFKIVKLRDILGKEGYVKAFDFKSNRLIIAGASVKPSGKKKLYEITLRDGRVVKASADHTFFVEEGGRIVEKKLSELRVGDRLVVAGRLSRRCSGRNGQRR